MYGTGSEEGENIRQRSLLFEAKTHNLGSYFIFDDLERALWAPPGSGIVQVHRLLLSGTTDDFVFNE